MYIQTKFHHRMGECGPLINDLYFFYYELPHPIKYSHASHYKFFLIYFRACSCYKTEFLVVDRLLVILGLVSCIVLS